MASTAIDITDIFTLGPIVFDSFSTPQDPPFGGNQALLVHKLPGGARVIDTLGPDDHDYSFRGTFWGNNAAANAEALDALRMSGAPTTLAWGGRSWTVVVSSCEIICHRFPMHYSYSVTVVVAQNNMFGALGVVTATIDQMLSQDIATAMAIVGL